MARRRFFVAEIRRGSAELTGPEAEHLVRVLRVEAGQIFEISDNDKVYVAQVETARKSAVVFRVQEELQTSPPYVNVTLYAALIKFDRFELMVEKGTELGVRAIQPFEAERTDYGLLLASRKRRERWQKIALEASQQARRTQLPEIREPAPALGELQPGDLALFLDEQPGACPILQALPSGRRAADSVSIVVGPEGGWTERERSFAADSGWKSCSLGNTVLRAETAAISALAIVDAAWAIATG